MITLYGFAFSNYYNKVKFALLEKQIPFTEEATNPSQDQAFLEKSPLGKIPFIKTEQGYLSESQAILEYLEEAFPEHPLYPADAYQVAKVRELVQHLELNVELIARRVYGEVLSGATISQEIKDEVKTKVRTGLIGLSRLLKLQPYALGEQFSLADIIVWPHLQVVGYVTDKVFGTDLVAENIPGISAYINLIESRPHAKTVSEDRSVALAHFFRSKQG